MENKKLVRPAVGAKLAGVCAGIANYFGFDVKIVRIIYVVLTLFSAAFPGILLYLFLMLLMPKEMPGNMIENSVSDIVKKD